MRIKLFNQNEPIPKWWNNFLHSDLPSGVPSTVERINLALLPFNATFSVNMTNKGFGCRYIYFNTKAEYLMFILRWA
jgi:hypothetical protein